MDIREGDRLMVKKVNDQLVLENSRGWAERTSGIFASYAKNVAPMDANIERRWFEDAVASEVGASLDEESCD